MSLDVIAIALSMQVTAISSGSARGCAALPLEIGPALLELEVCAVNASVI
jgi:hypothetical protein